MLKGEDCFAFKELQVGKERITFGLIADGHGGREAAVHCTDCALEKIAQGAPDGTSARQKGEGANSIILYGRD